MLLEYKCADNDDIASIFAIQKRNVQLYEVQTVVDLREVLQQMQNHLQANIESYTKIVCGKNVVGYYRCKESYDFSYDLSFLYILQQYRKQGIGTQVLEHIKESCEDPLQIMIYLRQVEIYDFLVKRGFVVQSQISRSKISLKYDKKNKIG